VAHQRGGLVHDLVRRVGGARFDGSHATEWYARKRIRCTVALVKQGALALGGWLQSKTALIVPTLRYGDTADGVQERSGGDFVVTRDGKRLW
jgi:hypothetical protein